MEKMFKVMGKESIRLGHITNKTTYLTREELLEVIEYSVNYELGQDDKNRDKKDGAYKLLAFYGDCDSYSISVKFPNTKLGQYETLEIIATNDYKRDKKDDSALRNAMRLLDTLKSETKEDIDARNRLFEKLSIDDKVNEMKEFVGTLSVEGVRKFATEIKTMIDGVKTKKETNKGLGA